MAILCFIIPIITCLILFFGFRQAVVWWEYLLIIFLSSIITIGSYFIFKSVGIMDTEYLGYYVTKTRYYEPWNEYVHRTCTREVYDGTDEDGHAKYHAETYDCSYVDYHPAEWTMVNNAGNEIYLNKEEYNKVTKQLGTPLIFVDMHRHYHTIDGDMYECRFNGDRNRMWTLTSKHSYKNKILKSKSIFNFSEVSEEDKKEFNLYEYPEFNYINDQNPIMAPMYVPKHITDSFKYLNAYYGARYQFRTYVMIWRNAPIQTAGMQEDYFVGGNKNELCICISIDNSNKVQWVDAFSWEDMPDMVVGVNHLYKPGEYLDLMKLNRYLLETVPKKWKRKAFADFDYINTMLTSLQWFFVLMITIIANVFLAVFVINNEIDDVDSRGKYRQDYYHYYIN